MAGRTFAREGLSSSVGKFGPDVQATLSHMGSGQLLPCGLFVNEPEDGDQPNCEFDTPIFGTDDHSEVWPILPLDDLTGPVELTVRPPTPLAFLPSTMSMLTPSDTLAAVPLPHRCAMGHCFRMVHAPTPPTGTRDH